MSKIAIAGGAFAAALAMVAVVAGYRVLENRGRIGAEKWPPAEATPPSPTWTGPPTDPRGFLYGRIATVDGATYEGRLRFGGDQEAFWGDLFNGYKRDNPWAADVPAERLLVSRPLEFFGLVIAERKRPIELQRPFVARFGDLARIEARGRELRVTLKSGTAVHLDRWDASDFDDGVRVWDAKRGVVDLDSLRIRTIDLMPTPALGGIPERLHGTVRTAQGDFTGFVAWDRAEGVGSDALVGRSASGELRARFDSLSAIARESEDSARVTLRDGRQIVLSEGRAIGRDSRGIAVDDPRTGRVLVSWEAFARIDFTPGDSGPGYDDFPPGRPLAGSVTTRDGRHLSGRLVYDLDESETTDTLDAPSRGVSYAIPFGRVASIVLPGFDATDARATVTLGDGRALELELAGDLGKQNGGALVFAAGRERAEYVPWSEVARVDLDGEPATDPTRGGP